MTIDEAIEHAKEVARTCDDSQCAADHTQLAEWLRRARGADEAGRWYTSKIRELENENVRLRSCLSDDAENARQIMGENAKLRELARGLNWCTENAKVPSAECEHCPLGDTEDGELSCEKLMRELRIDLMERYD